MAIGSACDVFLPPPSWSCSVRAVLRHLCRRCCDPRFARRVFWRLLSAWPTRFLHAVAPRAPCACPRISRQWVQLLAGWSFFSLLNRFCSLCGYGGDISRHGLLLHASGDGVCQSFLFRSSCFLRVGLVCLVVCVVCVRFLRPRLELALLGFADMWQTVTRLLSGSNKNKY